jgi:hypothetical protein
MADEKKVEQKEVESVEEATAEEVDKTEKEDKTQQKEVDNTIPYDRFQQVIEEKNEYKNELEKLKDKLAEMEDPEELKKEYENKLDEISQKSIRKQKEFAVKEAALAENVNKKALNDFVQVADIDSLEVDDEGNVQGVKELIAKMKEEKDYFFQKGESNSSKTAGSFNNGNDDTGNDSNEDWAKKMADKFKF